jgi:hypothetical protein
MKLKQKKLIAREFLILISCFLLSSLAYLGTFPYNSIIYSNISAKKESIKSLKGEIHTLEQKFGKKIQIQDLFFRKSKEQGIEGDGRNSSELWSRLETLQRADSIIFKWNRSWSYDLRARVVNIGFKNGEELNNFILKNSLNTEEKEYKRIVDINKAEVQSLEYQLITLEFNQLDEIGQFEFAIIFLIILAVLLFPFRYIIYGIKWSIKIVTEKG